VVGLFYGGGVTQLLKQLAGSASTVAATLAVSLILMFALKYAGVLRVSKEGELEGLDLHEHGASAYPEYALAVGDAGLVTMNGHEAVVESTESAAAGD
jgi:Amt family ammonium transporter